MSGLTGDYSECCAWDLARPVLLDANLKWKEDFDYVAGRVCEMADGPTNWRHVIECRFVPVWHVAILFAIG